MLVRLSVLAAALLLSTGCGAIELTDPVPGHPDKTYADLAAQFVEGFALDGSGLGSADITTAIRYADQPEAIPEESELLGKVKVVGLDAVTIRTAGKPALALKVDLDVEEGGWPLVVLGAFDSELKIIDYARIDRDRFVSVEPPIAMSDRDDGLLVRSTHFNAGENFEAAQLVYLSGNALTALPAMYGYSEMMCGYQDTETIGFSVRDDGQPGFRPVIGTLTRDHKVDDTCDPPGDAEDADTPSPGPIEPSSTFSGDVTYVWSASIGGYVEQSETISTMGGEPGFVDGDDDDEGSEAD